MFIDRQGHTANNNDLQIDDHIKFDAVYHSAFQSFYFYFKGNGNLSNPRGDMAGIQRISSTMHCGPTWDKNRYDTTNIQLVNY